MRIAASNVKAVITIIIAVPVGQKGMKI